MQADLAEACVLACRTPYQSARRQHVLWSDISTFRDDRLGPQQAKHANYRRH